LPVTWSPFQRGVALLLIVLGLAVVVAGLSPSIRAKLFTSGEVSPWAASAPVGRDMTARPGPDSTREFTGSSLSGGAAKGSREGMVVSKNEQLAQDLNEGNRLLRDGQLPEAITRYQHALEVDPNSEDAHFNLGIALAKQGKVQEAIGHYTEALRIMPDYTEAHNNLGNLLAGLGRFDEAIQHFETALRIMPDHATAHNNLGSALARQGRVPEAVTHFLAAVRLLPDYLEAHFNLSMAYLAQNRDTEAAAELKEVLRLKPDFEPARRALENIRPPPSQPATNQP